MHPPFRGVPGLAPQQPGHHQPAQEDGGRNECQPPDVVTFAGQVEVQGDRQQPELNAHQHDPDRQRRHDDRFLPRRWRHGDGFRGTLADDRGGLLAG